MTVRYRQAGPEDMAAVYGLLGQMAAEMGRAVRSTEADLWAHGFGPAQRFRAVLAEAEAPVGLALICPEFSSWRGQAGLYVQDLYVRPEARGGGVAQALLAAAWAAAADWGPAYMTLMVDHRNDVAQAWYARRGFTLRERGDLLVLEAAGVAALGGAGP